MNFVGRPMGALAKIRCRYHNSETPRGMVEARISAFLEGRNNGEELLHALFDHVLHEPMPASMRAILRPQLAERR